MVVDWSGDMSKSFEREHHFTYHFVAFRFSHSGMYYSLCINKFVLDKFMHSNYSVTYTYSSTSWIGHGSKGPVCDKDSYVKHLALFFGTTSAAFFNERTVFFSRNKLASA